MVILRLLGHRWPREIQSHESKPPWASPVGIICLTETPEEPSLLSQLRGRLAEDFRCTQVLAIEREFQQIVGKSLHSWLAADFFKRHTLQFRKRPIAWQLQSQPAIANSQQRGTRLSVMRRPAFGCLVYYHQLEDADLLPKLRSHYLGGLRASYEIELRILERVPKPTVDQATRKAELDILLDELQRFDTGLQAVAEAGFGPEPLRPRLRQLAVDEAMLVMKARWLARLRDTLEAGPLQGWQATAADLGYHADFPSWIAEAISHIPRHCAKAGAQAPNADTMPEDPTPVTLAAVICAETPAMTCDALTLACAEWQRNFDTHVIGPLRSRIAAANESLEHLTAELDALEHMPSGGRIRFVQDQARLRSEVRGLKREITEKTEQAAVLRSCICSWTSPVLGKWEPWLAASALFDTVSSLDGRRAPPATIRDFIRQESIYAPDLNDGVRVNIAPLQRTGLLAADVIGRKDVEKAIADRAEWRADERRWCREGKLPRPGWWPEDAPS